MGKATIPKTTQKAMDARQPAKRLSSAPKTGKAIESVGRYINPLTDFGFKHIFGTKEFLMDFLNAVLVIEGGIIELFYDNTERRGQSKDDRTTYFDLYCTLGTGERIMIEMQYQHQEYFKDRTLYYLSRLIQEQGEDKKGDKHWGFELHPVYSVNIVNFSLNKTDIADNKNRLTDKYVSYVQLMDRDTKEVFYKKLTLVFMELPYFTKAVHELTDNIDWWMYVLKNMATLEHLPDALQKQIFKDLFLKAEIVKLSRKERKEYDRSLKKLRDMNVIIADRDRKIADRDRIIAVLSKDKAALSKDKAALSKDKAALSKDNAALSKDNAEKDRLIAELKRELWLKTREKNTN